VIVTYLRSSSSNCWDLCEFQYTLEYVLGLKGGGHWKAERGNMLHKALELLARRKLCEQTGSPGFVDPELGRYFWADIVGVEFAARCGFEHYRHKNESGRAWCEDDYQDVLRWTRGTVEFNDGMFSPLKRNIISPEQFFDLPIEEPWAWYDFRDPHTGERVRGHLRIKGTIDLVTEAAPGVMEYLDWKSGRVWDWAKDKEKCYETLRHDPQLLLYFYALSRLYPNYRSIFVTIFFSQFNLPFTIPFDRDSDVPLALKMIREKFEAIKGCHRPRRIMDDPDRKWKCFSFCPHSKGRHPESNRMLCDHYHSELQKLGMEKLIQKHGRPGAAHQYGSGGGLSKRE
jgi:hypothetical protein